MPEINGRRKAAFLIGVVVATPAIIIGTARSYSESHTKGIITGLISYGIVLVASFLTAKYYDGSPRYGEHDEF
jgi:hypothetical protein